jgi:hypothetical protein
LELDLSVDLPNDASRRYSAESLQNPGICFSFWMKVFKGMSGNCTGKVIHRITLTNEITFIFSKYTFATRSHSLSQVPGQFAKNKLPVLRL